MCDCNYEELKETAKHHLKKKDKKIREHPYESIAIVSGVSTLVGLIVGYALGKGGKNCCK